LHSRFREVLLLDADNVPVVDPEFLFETPQFTRTGALFWPDFHGRGHNIQARLIWRSCGLREPKEKEFETGQIMVDKQRCWKALNLCLWMNEHSDFYYRYVHGDKETFHLAFRKARKSYSLVPFAIHPLKGGTMCQHDFTGRRVFQHRNMDKWDLLLCNRRIPDFWREEDCLRDVITLRGLWDGSVNARKPNHSRPKLRAARSITLEAVMISCPERSEVREQTLHDLAKTDWGDWELHIEVDPQTEGNPQERQTACAFRALSKALRRSADYVLFLEDDLSFNLWLRHNLMNWPPLLSGFVSLAGLYNPGLREEGCSVPTRSRFVAPGSIFGSQAFLLSKEAVRFIVRNWNRVQGMQDIRISRLAGRLRTPICYHAPSLVQHRSGPSTWGGRPHQAFDFDETWRR
jgi:hypothetical protein